MAIKLVVTNPFAGYEVGQEITDTAKVKEFTATHPGHVVKVAVPDDAAPAPAAPSMGSTPSN